MNFDVTIVNNGIILVVTFLKQAGAFLLKIFPLWMIPIVGLVLGWIVGYYLIKKAKWTLTQLYIFLGIVFSVLLLLLRGV